MLHLILNYLLLQSSGGGTIPFWITMGGVMIVFYFFMIRPQQKKQQDQKKFIDDISKGDEVVTIGGMHGKVYAIDGETVTLSVDKGAKLVFDKSSISMEASKRVQEKINQ